MLQSVLAVLLTCFAKLQNDYPETSLLIVGSGPTRIACTTASICSKGVVPKYGGYFASRRNGARRKAAIGTSQRLGPAARLRAGQQGRSLSIQRDNSGSHHLNPPPPPKSTAKSSPFAGPTNGYNRPKKGGCVHGTPATDDRFITVENGF